MGSRLRMSDAKAPTWDVDASLEMYAWLDAEVVDMRGWLHHDESSATLITDGPYTAEQNARGWGTISSTYYRELLLHLEDEIDLGPAIRGPVYAFGYDGRKSNGDSATKLVEFTRATLDAEGAEEAIFVTHSMGGLVARAAIKRDAWLESRTIGVVHLAQPACGAPVADGSRPTPTSRSPLGWPVDRGQTSASSSPSTATRPTRSRARPRARAWCGPGSQPRRVAECSASPMVAAR